MSNSVGMAIRITPSNCEKIAVVNGGVAPKIPASPAYFIFPYNFDISCTILPANVFKVNYEFANTESEDYFVDINEI